MKIMKGLAISRNHRPDSYGWMFTESGKYTVKSGYKTDSSYPDKGQRMVSYGPDTKPLLAFTWKLNCEAFFWQTILGTLPDAKKAHGIDCDTPCSIFGARKNQLIMFSLSVFQLCKP